MIEGYSRSQRAELLVHLILPDFTGNYERVELSELLRSVSKFRRGFSGSLWSLLPDALEQIAACI